MMFASSLPAVRLFPLLYCIPHNFFSAAATKVIQNETSRKTLLALA
jgi:hypothetical protein